MFLPNVPGATFIPESRVREEKTVCRKNAFKLSSSQQKNTTLSTKAIDTGVTLLIVDIQVTHVSGNFYEAFLRSRGDLK